MDDLPANDEKKPKAKEEGKSAEEKEEGELEEDSWDDMLAYDFVKSKKNH